MKALTVGLEPDLFGAVPALPTGFRYRREVLSRELEVELLEHFRELPFREFEMNGYLGKRRVVSYGWKYDFDERILRQSGEIPDFLIPIREIAAKFAGIRSSRITQALVSEYGPGAGIGWHRDRPVFGDVIGISLSTACVFRLRRKSGISWERASLMAEPRSAYLLRGPSRTQWQHSIPPVDALRYSITFRTFRAAQDKGPRSVR
jgi:alkylated DNA repair dioxygenase AlkB